MTYSTGGLIQASDYNSFAANVNPTWNTAYGQTTVANVAQAGTVTATQWATLNSSIAAMGAHQGTTITSRTNPTAGTVISILANVATDIASCSTNKYNAASQGSQYTAWTGTASKTSTTGSGNQPWTITFTHTVTFANATAATNFFAAGGLMKIQFGKTSTGTVADTEWNNFVGNGTGNKAVAGAVYLSADSTAKNLPGFSGVGGTFKTGGSGTPSVLTSGIGFNQLTGSAQTIYQQYDTVATYTGNYIRVNASFTGSALTFTTTWFDDGGAGTGSTDVINGGTASSGTTFGTAPSTIITYIAPEETNLTNSWGTPTIAATTA